MIWSVSGIDREFASKSFLFNIAYLSGWLFLLLLLELIDS